MCSLLVAVRSCRLHELEAQRKSSKAQEQVQISLRAARSSFLQLSLMWGWVGGGALLLFLLLLHSVPPPTPPCSGTQFSRSSAPTGREFSGADRRWRRPAAARYCRPRVGVPLFTSDRRHQRPEYGDGFSAGSRANAAPPGGGKASHWPLPRREGVSLAETARAGPDQSGLDKVSRRAASRQETTLRRADL